jgi:hypothetical protein
VETYIIDTNSIIFAQLVSVRSMPVLCQETKRYKKIRNSLPDSDEGTPLKQRRLQGPTIGISSRNDEKIFYELQCVSSNGTKNDPEGEC